MYARRAFAFIGPATVLTALALLTFAVLHVLQVSAGGLLDWVIGLAGFWWLVVVVTVPWNIHFDARQVLADAADSRERGIPVKPEAAAYARSWVGRSLALALALHAGSAAALYWLAAAGISPVGYVGAAAALLLTVLRPAVRAYEYVAGRLAAIRHELRYPREDVLKMRGDLEALTSRLAAIETLLDAAKPESLVARQQAAVADLRRDLRDLQAAAEALRTTNHVEHERLASDAQHAIAQITADGQFLEHARELIRFFKQA